jgi:hypothetical protein
VGATVPVSSQSVQINDLLAVEKAKLFVCHLNNGSLNVQDSSNGDMVAGLNPGLQAPQFSNYNLSRCISTQRQLTYLGEQVVYDGYPCRHDRRTVCSCLIRRYRFGNIGSSLIGSTSHYEFVDICQAHFITAPALDLLDRFPDFSLI